MHFEKIAENIKWPKAHWPILLQSVLTGKARDVFTQLTVEQAQDYDCLKAAILRAYEMVPEAYRQRFRSTFKKNSQTHVDFSRQKEMFFDRWCDSIRVDKDFVSLRQLMLIEEFKNCIHPDIKTFIDEKKPGTIHDAAVIADEYYLTHKVDFVNKPNQPRNTNFHPRARNNNTNNTRFNSKPDRSDVPNSSGKHTTPSLVQVTIPRLQGQVNRNINQHLVVYFQTYTVPTVKEMDILGQIVTVYKENLREKVAKLMDF